MMTSASLSRLLKEKGCVDSLVTRLETVLASHDPKYREAIEAWVLNNDQRLLTVEGYSTRDIIRMMGGNYPNAVSCLIWLEDEPEIAKEALDTGFDDLVITEGGDAHD